ncbi:2-hexaprenyl-6-methoxy-1,4-benzoquinone methyltransferase [Elasticomyces elasticus]|nr:2-hexaprenyl-6-methoxy-1,4-benzoquinone methyltransferase [Elasticomyces elasticus]
MATLIPRAAKRLKMSHVATSAGGLVASRPFSAGWHHQQQQQQQQQKQASPPSADEGAKTTHFGFETVPESMKEGRVAGVFSSVASSYDTMNDLMSLGIHRLWKDHFVRSLNPGSPRIPSSSSTTTPEPEPWHILDIAGGTGDIALRLLDHATLINHDTRARVTVADINPAMLSAGRARFATSPYTSASNPRLTFVEANAEKLHSIPDASVDLYTVAFGIRNFTDKARALREAHRVLKPGGVFACLEFSKVSNPLLDAAYKRWSFAAIPLIGQLVAGDRHSYQYLVESIERFPSQPEFRDMIAEAGFLIPGEGWEDLTGGIAAIHKGVKPV